jgi:hypothetical protein
MGNGFGRQHCKTVAEECEKSSLIDFLRKFFCNFVLASFAAMFSGYASAIDHQECLNATEVPFAGQALGNQTWHILVAPSSDVFCIRLPNGTFSIGDLVPLFVHVDDKTSTVIGRQLISGHLRILQATPNGQWREADLDFDQRSKLHVEGGFILGDQVFILAYDVAYNLPSGRRREVPREVVGLYRLENDDEASLKLTLANEALFEAGLESGIKVAQLGSSVWVCAAAQCKLLALNSGGISITASVLKNEHKGNVLEILELVPSPDGLSAYALAQRTFDDRIEAYPAPDEPVFALCQLSKKFDCKDIPADSVPYQLGFDDERPTFKSLRKGDDPSELLLFDLHRSGLTGVGNFGENNLEGRLAWSAAYYLNGIVSAIDLSADLKLNKQVQALFIRRYVQETTLLTRLIGFPYPGLTAKRYSLDREPITALLHIGRIIKPLFRGKMYLANTLLEEWAAAISSFAEGSGGLEEIRRNITTGSYESYVRTYSPFWADGGRVPWNYQSGWIEGLAWTISSQHPSAKIAKSMIGDFLIDTKMINLPEKWAYTSDNTLDGWRAADRVSTNTPDYDGDKSNLNGAHISYRSMDAMAVLAAERVGFIDQKTTNQDHFIHLIEKGYLYPFLNEELSLIGQKAQIPFHIARLYARSHLPWQLQNQPWALASITQSE